MGPMLVIHPGPNSSTFDVYRGLVDALWAEGHNVIRYPLDRGLTLGSIYCQVLEDKGFLPKSEDMNQRIVDVMNVASVFSLDRALHHDVEWVFVVAGRMFHPDFLVKLRRAGRKIAILFTEAPYESDHEAEYAVLADVIFTNERTTAQKWAAAGAPCYYLPHAYDPVRHHPGTPEDEPEVPAHDVVFVGTGWPERVAMFEQVDWTGIDLGIYGIHFEKFASKASPLRRYFHPGVVPNDQTAALYRRAKIGLNLHRSHPTAESLNPRARELAAAGLFHLSDARAEVAEIFGYLVPTFETPQELESLIRTYLADDAKRAAVADQLPGMVAHGHTFADRAAMVVKVLEKTSKQMGQITVNLNIDAPIIGTPDGIAAVADHIAQEISRA